MYVYSINLVLDAIVKGLSLPFDVGPSSMEPHYLKGHCHKIFDPCFFPQSITPRPQINTLKIFEFCFLTFIKLYFVLLC
jgi:hypothetical protein